MFADLGATEPPAAVTPGTAAEVVLDAVDATVDDEAVETLDVVDEVTFAVDVVVDVEDALELVEVVLELVALELDALETMAFETS